MADRSEAMLGIGCWTVILLIVGIPITILGLLNKGSESERHKIVKIENCYNTGGSTSFIISQGNSTHLRRGEIKFNREPIGSFYIDIERGYFWFNKYTIGMKRKLELSRVFMHESNRYTICYTENNEIVSIELIGAKIMADVPEDEPMYLEIEHGDAATNTAVEMKIHIHSAKELDGVMWREHQNKRPDRTGMTSVVE